MKKLAPEIVRQRLLLEGYFGVEVDRDKVEEYLVKLAAHLELRTYGRPIVFSPDSGMGKDKNAGFDAFVPLIDSGISAYFWSKQKFFSVVIYTCKEFSEEQAIAFSKNFLDVTAEYTHFSF